jgi:D-galactarolactone isomerase
MENIRLETAKLALACDCHMHIWDPRFPLGPAHTPTRDATVADYLRVRERLGLGRVVVVQSTAYGTDNECTLDAIRQMGDSARGVAIVAPDVADGELARLTCGGHTRVALRHVRGTLIDVGHDAGDGAAHRALRLEHQSAIARRGARRA